MGKTERAIRAALAARGRVFVTGKRALSAAQELERTGAFPGAAFNINRNLATVQIVLPSAAN